MSGPIKGEPAGQPTIGAVDNATVLHVLGRPVTGTSVETPLREEWRFYLIHLDSLVLIPEWPYSGYE